MNATATVVAVPTCRCGHARQIHGAEQPGNAGGVLTPGGPRGIGACTARCWCDTYVERTST